jgi:hypothetical protein
MNRKSIYSVLAVIIMGIVGFGIYFAKDAVPYEDEQVSTSILKEFKQAAATNFPPGKRMDVQAATHRRGSTEIIVQGDWLKKDLDDWRRIGEKIAEKYQDRQISINFMGERIELTNSPASRL